MVRLVRPVNLFIVGITMMIFYFFLIAPTFYTTGITATLNNWLFTCLMIMVLLITAGGYVINDMLDVETDVVNKPSQAIGSGGVSIKTARATYAVLNVLAIFIAGYLAAKSNNYMALVWCAGGILLLWAYSRYLKSTVLMGNVVVSLLIGLVPFIFVIVEQEAFQILKEQHSSIYISVSTVIISFSIFAFLSNLIREIIKDCEDYEGDKGAGIVTIATALGYRKSDMFSGTLTVILFVASIGWIFLKDLVSQKLELLAYLFFIVVPIIFMFYLIVTGERSKDKYTKASNHCKLLMVFGLIYLIIHLYRHHYA